MEKGRKRLMEYYRHGCCLAGVHAPGGNVLIGLMRKLDAPCGEVPEGLVLLEAQMSAGVSCALARQSRTFLVHIMTGSVRAISGADEAQLIAGDTLRISSHTEQQFSTRGTLGMTALFILPQQRTSRSDDSWCLSVRGTGGSLRSGEPQPMAVNALDIFGSLTPLTSEGCLMPIVQLARGNFNRNGIVAALLPRYAADPMALRAFIWHCNAHPTPWWQNRNGAQRLIVEGVAKLLKALKQNRG